MSNEKCFYVVLEKIIYERGKGSDFVFTADEKMLCAEIEDFHKDTALQEYIQGITKLKNHIRKHKKFRRGKDEAVSIYEVEPS